MRVQRIHSWENKNVASQDEDLCLLDPLLEKYKDKKGSLIPILQGAQNLYGYIPKDAFVKIANKTGFKLSTMYGVATFYAQFRLSPVGKHIIKVCHGTACHVQDAKMITETLKDNLNVEDGATTEDGLFTLESVACLGCCSLAPVLMIGDDTYGKLDRKSTVKIIKDLKRKEKNAK